MARDKKAIRDLVYKMAEIAKLNDQEMIENAVEKLSNMSPSDVIDKSVVYMAKLARKEIATMDEIKSVSPFVTALNGEKYKTMDDLLTRYNWIRSMNMEYCEMPLTENHQLVLEAFDSFNAMIGTNLDCFYTGGLMAYLATGQPLERYHGDLDLFIDEKELPKLYKYIRNNPNFQLISHLSEKEENGHEFSINYKGSPMSIGLFLFDRKKTGEVVQKSYYYPQQNRENGLSVTEHHLSQEFARDKFDETIHSHGGHEYRAESLESIYSEKKDLRPKDRYDAKVISDHYDLDMSKVARIEAERQSGYEIKGKSAEHSIVAKLDGIITGAEIKKV